MRIVRYSYPNYRSPILATGRVSRSPWSGFETEVDRWFENALADFGDSASSTRVPVDLYEDKENAYVRAALPGVNRDEIGVEVADGQLTITATRKPSENGASSEQSFTLTRSITLPAEVQVDRVTAAYENGILSVTLPKREEAKPKRITVAVK